MWIVCGLCLISLFIVCRAVPISRESSSNERGIYFDKSREKFVNESVCVSDDVLYKEGDAIPTASVCERCVCRPPDIACEVIRCEKKSGCRAIQRPNKCCPEYKCDCEADGRIYQNGERLENPESPCRVCYCQSGEIVCTVIKCYTRDDCMPRYVTGKCCPKYDHCPPIDPTPLMFYTTPETSSESAKSSSVGYEADIAETSNISQENIQDNTVDTSKWIELVEEKSNNHMSAPDTPDDYGKDIYFKHSSAETSDKEKNVRDKLHKENTEVYDDSQGTSEEGKRQENYNDEIQTNTEFHTETTDIGKMSKIEGSDKLDLQQNNTEVYNESTDGEETSKKDGSSEEELQQDNTEANAESTGTGQMVKLKENDKELQDETQTYTEGTGTGEIKKVQGDVIDEEQDKTEVYHESTGSGEIIKNEGNEKELKQNNTEVYNERIHTGEMSKNEAKSKDELQQNNSEVYNENIDAGEISKNDGSDKEELQQDNTEVHKERIHNGEMNKNEGSNMKELQQDSTGAYTEITGTTQTSKVEGNVQEELLDNTEAYTEGADTEETRKRQGNDSEVKQDKTEVYDESTGTGELSKREGSSNEELQQDNTEFYTESTGTMQVSKIEANNKEEVPDTTEAYTENTGTGGTMKTEENDKEEVLENSEAHTENTGTGETTKSEGNNKEEVLDNTEAYTENASTGDTMKTEWNDKEEVLDNTEAYTENASTGETTKTEGNDKEEVLDYTEAYTGATSKLDGNAKEMQQDNTDIDASSTDTGGTNKRERNDEELQQDDTKVYAENTGTGETSKREGNDKEELQEESTEVSAQNIRNSVSTHRSEEDKTENPSGKITNKIAETWLYETSTALNQHILEPEDAKNNGSLDEEVSSHDATKTEDNNMVKNNGALWYIGEVKESSTDSITYNTSQETEKHEISRNISEYNEGGSGTDPTQYETYVNSRETTVIGPIRGDDNTESLTGSGETDQGRYHEGSTESGNFENSSTTAIPDRNTQLTEHESKDTVPVVTFQSNMELHNMDLVVPGLDSMNLQVDFDIKATETNPVIGIDSEINTLSEHGSVTNIRSADDQNASGLDDKTVQNSSDRTENVKDDESSTASITTSTASLTSNSTRDIMSEFQETERTESSVPTMLQSETAYNTKTDLSVASLLMHNSATKTQSEEITTPTVDSTTPDILEGEHPLNAKDYERTEQIEATVKETLHDVTAVNSESDSHNMQESNAVTHITDKGVSHTAPISEHFRESDWNAAPTDETETSTYFTIGATEGSEKILAAVDAFKSNKTANATEMSDVLPKEWLKTNQVTTVTNPEGAHLDEAESQTAINNNKAEEFTSTLNYSHDESRYLYESKSVVKTGQPKETDTTNTEWATESMSTTSISVENSDKYDNYLSNKTDSQMLTNVFFSESPNAKENGSDNASEEMEATTGEQGMSTVSNQNSHEIEMPFWYNFFSHHGEKHNEREVSDTSATDIIPKSDLGFTGSETSGGQDDNESWISDAVKKSWEKQPNKLEKIYPESFRTEDNSTDYDRQASDEPVFVKEVQAASFSSSSYEMNSHDFYGIGDYYVSSSESGLTYNITGVHSEPTSTVTSPSSEEQSTNPTTVRSRDYDNGGNDAQEYTDIDTTVRPTESTATNRTESALESTIPGLLENVNYSAEITKSSEINIKNSLEDSQNTDSLNTKLDENVGTLKLEQALYESSDSHQENYSS